MFRGNLNLIICLFILVGAHPALGGDATSEGCIASEDFTVIAENFAQFAPFLKETGDYCATDLGEQGTQWVSVLQSLVALKNSQALEPDHDPEDALTFKAVSEPNWWAYFINRAKAIEIPTNCPQGAAAYVVPFAMNSTIYLCEPFFSASMYSQASIMMHEVRHFDGHSHLTCTRGLDKGQRGACDPDILAAGSYAISVQTLVALARSPQIQEADRLLLESEAIFTAFHRFNTIAQVKMIEQMVVADAAGEVFEWSPQSQELQPLAQLEQPAALLNSYDNLTIYPLDTNHNAYRKDRKLRAEMESRGLFANHYNSESIEGRALYKSVSYLGAGGLIRGNELLTTCGDSPSLLTQDLSSLGEVKALISISEDESDVDRQSQILTTSGQLITMACHANGRPEVTLEPAEQSMSAEIAQQIVESFSHRGQQYALLENGDIVTLVKEGPVYTSTQAVAGLEGRQWVSLTPMNLPELFN